MIKSVTVINPRNEILTLELGNPNSSGFAIVDIPSGLGPPKATVNFTSISTGDGDIYNSARVGGRNVVLNIRFTDSPDIEAARLRSYRYFPIKKQVLLIIETDTRTVSTFGTVESNTPTVFSKESGCQISILCADPYLYGLTDAETAFSTVESGFTFPFGNESLTVPTLIFGIITIKQAASVIYDGEVDTGMIINIHATGTITNLSITNMQTLESMHIDTTKLTALVGQGLIAGDDIVISTIKGSKSIYHIRNGVYTNIMLTLGRQTSWFTLSSGDNVFTYMADTGINNIQFRITNRIVYEGV